MDKSIYEVLNDVTINVEDYEDNENTKAQQMKWVHRVQRELRQRRRRKILQPLAAGIVGIVILGYTTPLYAMTNPFLYQIADFIGTTNTLEAYRTMIDASVSQKGLTVQLGEAIYDQDELTFTIRLTSEEVLPKYVYFGGGELYINGNKYDVMSGWARERGVDQHTVEIAISTVGLPELSGDVGIKLILREFGIGDEVIKGKWQFSFSTSGEELREETVGIFVNQEVRLPNGKVLIVEKYTANPVSQKVYFKTPQSILTDYQVAFELCNEVGTYSKEQGLQIEETGGVMKWEGIPSSDQQKMTLSVKVAQYGKAYEKLKDEIHLNGQ